VKRALVVVAVLVVALVGAEAAWYYHQQTRPNKIVRGSSTVEFVTTQAPEPKPPPKKVARVIPWTTYGYDVQRTHVAPSSFKVRPPYRRRWMVRLGYYIEFPPAVGYGRVFIAQLKGRFLAVWQQSGQKAWNKKFDDVCTAASPTLAKGVIYQPFVPAPCTRGSRGGRGYVVAMSTDGKILWRFPVASESSTLYEDGTLYFGAWNHRLYALDVRGPRPRVRWTYEASGELNTAPAYANGTIYIGGDDGRVYAVAAKTGRLRWRASAYSHLFGRREYFYATPTIAYGRVYIGNTDGTVYCFGATTGHLIWTQRAGSYVYTAAAVWNRTVYVGSYDGRVFALDAATGDVKWTYDSPGSIHGAPTVVDGLIYFSTCGTCGSHGSRYAKRGPQTTFALDARTGKLVWTFPDGRYSPVVADLKRIYLVGSTRVYALDPLRAVAKRAPARKPHARSRKPSARSGPASPAPGG
jgi:outer membrane protein assembly factor BamB